MGIPVPMLNIPPPHMMMPLNPFSAPPPSFNTQIFGNAVPVPMSNTATDDHMDIEGDEETSNTNTKNKGQDSVGHNNAPPQNVFNQPPSGGQRNDDRNSREPPNRRQGNNRWNSAEREDSYERDNNRRPRDMRYSGGGPMRNDRNEKPLQDRLRDMAGVENRGNNGGHPRFGGGGGGSYDRDNYGSRDNRGGRYNDKPHHQMGMQRNGELLTVSPVNKN